MAPKKKPRETPAGKNPERVRATRRSASSVSTSASESAGVQASAGNLAMQRAARESGKEAVAQSATTHDVALASLLQTPPAHERHRESVRRMYYALVIAERDAAAIMTILIPAYKKARDGIDAEAVAELGGKLLGAFSRMNGAKAAVDELSQTVGHQSMVGSSAEQDLENFQLQQYVDTHLPALEQKISEAGSFAMDAMVPHEFRGEEVAGERPLPNMQGSPEVLRERLADELDRTLEMLMQVREITALVLKKPDKLDRDVFNRGALARARSLVWGWVSRPIDIAFLKAALGIIWNVLDATAGKDAKPSDALAQATKQAQHTGWLADIGEFNIQEADMWLRIGGQENAAIVLRQLYTTDPDTRARLLMQMKQRNLLHKFCASFGWAPIKELHDSLGTGFAEIKTDLQGYFIGGKDKWGPSLTSEWESHNNSLFYHIGRIPWVGGALNTVYDFATFGFHSSYGQTRDAYTSGQMSEGEYSNARRHLINRTVAMAFVSLVTGGAADKVVRGTATAVSTARAVGAGFTSGVVGSTAGLATSDVYNVYVSGEQEGFSSPEDYIKTALVGGVFGAGLSGVAHGLSKGARSYVPDEAIAAEESAVAAGDPVLGETTWSEPVVAEPMRPVDLPEPAPLTAMPEPAPSPIATPEPAPSPTATPEPVPNIPEPAPPAPVKFKGPDPGSKARGRASKKGIRRRKKMAYDRMSAGEYDPLQDLLAADEIDRFLRSGGKKLPKNIDWHHTRQSSADPSMADVPEHIQPLRVVEHKFDEHSARSGDVPTAGIRQVTSPEKPIYDPNAPEVQTARYNPNEGLGEGSFQEEALSTRDFGKRAPPNFKDIGKVREPALKSQYDYKAKLKLDKKSPALVFMRHKATGEWHQIKVASGVFMRKIGKGDWEPVPLE